MGSKEELKKISEEEIIRLAEEYANAMGYEGFSSDDMRCITAVGKFCIYSIDKIDTGLMLIEYAAQKGDPKAQLTLGDMFFFGDHVSTNCTEAVSWFRKAANQGYPGGINNLGHCLINGQGCEKNEAEGLELIREAAMLESKEAFEGLGHCYYFGIGTEKDPIMAREWWMKAASRGNQLALENLKKYYESSNFMFLPYEIIKNAFNSANFEGVLPYLDEDSEYKSDWNDVLIKGRDNIEKHLHETSKKILEGNIITRARVAVYKNAQDDHRFGESDKYCVELIVGDRKAVVILNWMDCLIKKIEILDSDKINYSLIETPDILSKEEIHSFGIDFILEDLSNSGYDIISCNHKPDSFPQIQAAKDGIFYIIVVETEVSPFMGRLSEYLKDQILMYAGNNSVIPCFASVGIGSVRHECFSRALAVRNAGFYINYEGLEMLEDSKRMN